MSISSTMTALADAVRTFTGTTGKITVAVMKDRLLDSLLTSVTNPTVNLWRGTSLTSYTVPAGTTRIADKCPVFKYQYNLTSISLPAGLVYIGAYTFNNTKISSITIPASVETIGYAAFRHDSDTPVSTVIFSSNNHLTYIHGYAFSGTAIQSINIPQFSGTYNTLNIEASAFESCKNLTNVTVDVTNRNLFIREDVFNGDTALTSMSLVGTPLSVSVGARAFYDCTALTSVSTYLASNASDMAFGYSGLQSVVLRTPTFATNIGLYVFRGCTNLASVVAAEYNPVDKAVPTGTFADCISLNSIMLNDSIQRIEDYAFSNTSLDELPVSPTSRLTTIGAYAFAQTKITDLSILGELDIDLINNRAFYKCTQLTRVVFHDGNVIIGRDAFEGCSGVQFLYKGDTAPEGFPWGATNSTIEGIVA